MTSRRFVVTILCATALGFIFGRMRPRPDHGPIVPGTVLRIERPTGPADPFAPAPSDRVTLRVVRVYDGHRTTAVAAAEPGPVWRVSVGPVTYTAVVTP